MALVLTLLLTVPPILYFSFALIFGWARLRYTDAGVVTSFREIPRKKVKKEIDGVEQTVEVANLLLCGRGPGGFVMLSPGVDRLRPYPVLEDVRDWAEVANVLTAAPNPINMNLEMEVVYRYVDVGQAAISTPDGDPIDEARNIAIQAMTEAIRSHTIEWHTSQDGVSALRDEILHRLQSSDLLKSWGIKVRGVVITDVDFDEDYKIAQEDIMRQKAAAEAKIIETKAEVESDKLYADEARERIDMLGIDYVKYVEALQNDLRKVQALAKSGAVPTYIQAGGGVTETQVDPAKVAEMMAAWDSVKNKGGNQQ